jgi:membrane protein CcdC involved in cytochrome C biogenesis
MPPAQSGITAAITLAIVVLVIALRWRRMNRAVPLKPGRLWFLPTLYAGLVAAMYARFPPNGWNWAFCLLALALGGALGWQRGRTMRIEVDPVSHELRQTASPAALLFIVVVMVARRSAQAGAGWLHLDMMAITDMLLAFALGLIAMQRVEMFLRARRLLAAARAIPA